ncbi:DUF2075 domain-containing protein [Sporolactobacillus sp. THM19-2]|jgi:DUF2075 family protein|uniref:DUF2075 domain-containing protein n=1 Tax=Sporolactobacillus sp. THM19-2 TaxID=2511171 RepID=UPI0010212149|nr:DUF2075 domain-containing protein [Sporolactobacillus sp. THM19-2]RYL94144.1 DUF2075 domain-containing protein [Sporolactobacillus sp. THM19-2]
MHLSDNKAVQRERENASIVKLSPFRTLSEEQKTLKDKIIKFCRAHVSGRKASVFVIHGDAGTGKSVLLNTVFNEIQTQSRSDVAGPLYQTDNRLIVNHPEMLKLYRNISEKLKHVRKKDFERPTTFINQMHKKAARADIVLIDEAHLLLTKSDKYNRFYQNNQLEEILKLSRVVVMVFDEKQVLKLKSHWSTSSLQEIIGQYPTVSCSLTRQFRMHAHEDVLKWIDQFVHKKIVPFPEKQAFDFRTFADPGDMYHAIKEKNARVHLSRMVATYDYPYKLDGRDYFIREKNFVCRWDRYKPTAKKAWAEREDTIDEVGSVYTVQGFDLNYVGVILGPSVSYDEGRDRLLIDIDKYQDQAAFVNRSDLDSPDQIKERIILNSINVLMTRGVRGLYLYASDPKLRHRLLSLQRRRTSGYEL